jgi:dihydrofolate synthase/folylpolyglutamate synthase
LSQPFQQPQDLAGWLRHLEQLHPSTIELGLERVRRVFKALQLDFTASKVLTVGGTNGKGSSVTMLAGILRAAGYSVATYTSPHLLVYNERVTFNGRLATDAELCAGFAAVEQARAGVSLTYFEFGTLGALWFFAQQKPDFIILEVGLGGRLDAVNILDADASLLTNVDLDHMDWLGDTRDKIGVEKAGIFRSQRPAVYGERSMPVAVRDYAQQHHVPLLQQGREFGWKETGSTWEWHGRDRAGGQQVLGGLPNNGFPLDNAAGVLQILHQLDIRLPRAAIDSGLRHAQLAGRFQQTEYQGVRVVLDVAHNPHAAANLAANIRSRLSGCQVLLVLGMLGDKDSASVMRLLLPEVAHTYVGSLGGERGAPADILYNHAQQLGCTAVSKFASIEEAFAAASAHAKAHTQQSGQEAVVVACGSFFTVSAVLALL